MHISAKCNSRRELVFFDETNRRSIVRLVPEALAILMRKLWKSEDAYLLGMSETRLRPELARRGKPPTSTDSRIRLQFWLEYDRVQVENTKSIPAMDMAYVIGKSMAKEAFYTHYIQDPFALAWLMCPPVKYEDAIEEALRESTERIREAIALDLTKSNGEPNQKHLAFLLSVDKTLFQRWASLKKRAHFVPAGEEPETGDDVDDGKPAPQDLANAAKAERKAKIEAYRKEIAEREAQAKAETEIT